MDCRVGSWCDLRSVGIARVLQGRTCVSGQWRPTHRRASTLASNLRKLDLWACAHRGARPMERQQVPATTTFSTGSLQAALSTRINNSPLITRTKRAFLSLSCHV